MFEVQFLIPTVSNAGDAFTAEDHAAFEAALLGRFGGFTIYPGVAAGAWVSSEGRRFDDSHRVYAVAVSSLTDGDKIAAIVAFVKGHYQQEAVYLRYLGRAEIL